MRNPASNPKAGDELRHGAHRRIVVNVDDGSDTVYYINEEHGKVRYDWLKNWTRWAATAEIVKLAK